MKSFSKYLTESKKTFHFKVRLANCDLASETLDKIETALKQFDMVGMSKVKNHPPEDRSLEFPKVGTCEVKDFDVELNYPTNTPTVFEVIGSTPVTDGFGTVIAYNSVVKRSENQTIGL